jgi:hypothetical protein
MTLSRTLAAALVATAVAVPTANAQPLDPVAKPATTHRCDTPRPGHPSQACAQADRPVDGRVAALAQERYYSSYDIPASAQKQDLRSPDSRDAADGRGTFNAPDVTVVKVPQSAPSTSGIDWEDAALGAGIVLGLTLLGLTGAFAVVHRRQAGRQTATTG